MVLFLTWTVVACPNTMDAPGAILHGARLGELPLPFEDALTADPRPAFVLDVANAPPAGTRALDLSFCNRALVKDSQLLSSIERVVSTVIGSDDAIHFRRWLEHGRAWTGLENHAGTRFSGIYWTSFVVLGRYQVVSGNQCEHAPTMDTYTLTTDQSASGSIDQLLTTDRTEILKAHNVPKPHSRPAVRDSVDRRYDPRPPPSIEDEKVAIPHQLSVSMSPDWTAAEPQGVLSQHEVFARKTDWASTPLGPMSSWSAEFREVVNLLMRNPHPASLFWGQELTMIYNEPYSKEVAGNKHPGLMGSGFFGPFAELWESVSPIFQECARTGKSVRKENDRLLIERYGYLEETFFSWSWTPLYGGTNRILGFYNAPFETTYQTVNSRRMETLRLLGEGIAPAKSVNQFWGGVLAGLESNPYDIPFATLYSMTDSDSSDTASLSSTSTTALRQCVFEGSIAVPGNHPAAMSRIDLNGSDGMAPMFRAAINSNDPLLLGSAAVAFPEMLLDGIDYRGFQIPSREALIVPIRSMDGETTLALLMLGLNPRREYDKDYQAFAIMLSRQLTTSLSSLLRMEDEKRRNRTAAEMAALQQEKLTEELALQTSRLRRMTKHSPLGMFLFSPDGVLLEANERYYEMTSHSREATYEMSFVDTVAEPSKAAAVDMWQKMFVDRLAHSDEFQLAHNYNTAVNEEIGVPIDCWVLCSAVPELDGQDGNVRSVMGSITDISHMKWAQVLQDQRLREAEEAKRQQNAFIDITSHEMRNPMSAVLICADEIRDLLTQHHLKEDETMKACLEAANTIVLCVQHQKSIVDDILTVSKLNSKLLVISPIATQPVQVIQQGMRMFAKEATVKGIDLSLRMDTSSDSMGLEWFMLDPGRLLQITVNLITNAIKFTQTAEQRLITVHIGASSNPPAPDTPGFEYVPSREPCMDVTRSSDWGTGTLVYLRVRVTDTGCGLTPPEKKKLFERFSQASPRTHAQYGGSGLGLYISRHLSELHGGQIGAASEAGRGSTFGFFIQCRKAPDQSVNDLSQAALLSSAGALDCTSDMQLVELEQATALACPMPMSETLDPATLHVLVVEDNLINQNMLKRQLQKLGCSVNTADNGVLALEYLKSTELHKPGGAKLSVILMDLEMPEMDGLTCVTRIRELERNGTFQRRIPIIAVTANVRVEQLQTAKDSGMDDIVSKPFRIPELMARIVNLLQ